ncbi:unnamed protein product [Cochlearia groenlandica]
MEESKGMMIPLHDAIFITQSVENCLMKRIIVDNGNSVNILFLGAYKDISLDESKIVSRSATLVGFRIEVKQTNEHYKNLHI